MSAADEVAALTQLYAQAWDEGIFLVEWGWGMAAAGRREILQRLEEQTGRTIDHTVYQAFSLGDCFELGMAPGSGASRLDACRDAIQALKGPADSNPADSNPADSNPADGNPADGNLAAGNLVDGNPAAADKLAAGDTRTVAVGSPPQPLADWDSEQAGSRINPLLVWWSRLDSRYQIEVQRTGTGTAVLAIFDHQAQDRLVSLQPVSLRSDAVFGPDVGDLQAWQDLAVQAVDGLGGAAAGPTAEETGR